MYLLLPLLTVFLRTLGVIMKSKDERRHPCFGPGPGQMALSFSPSVVMLAAGYL